MSEHLVNTIFLLNFDVTLCNVHATTIPLKFLNTIPS